MARSKASGRGHLEDRSGRGCDNPASVVKELIENAIDAQASNIDIQIKNGGNLTSKLPIMASVCRMMTFASIKGTRRVKSAR